MELPDLDKFLEDYKEALSDPSMDDNKYWENYKWEDKQNKTQESE